jgi:hypothetical protein
MRNPVAPIAILERPQRRGEADSNCTICKHVGHSGEDSGLTECLALCAAQENRRYAAALALTELLGLELGSGNAEKGLQPHE